MEFHRGGGRGGSCCLPELHGGQNGAAYDFRDLRQDGIPAGSNSVHPVGNPINHSCRHGFVREGMYVPRLSAAFLELLPPAFETPLLRGVGNMSRDPKSISDMGGAKVGSLNAMPLSIIPERGQVPENSAEPRTIPSREKAGYIFHDCEIGSNFPNKARKLAPEAGSIPIDSLSTTRRADILARESSADCINGNSICAQLFGSERPDVVILGNLGPMLGEHAAAEWIDFAKCPRPETARSFETERKSSDPTEQIQKVQGLAHRTPPNTSMQARRVRVPEVSMRRGRVMAHRIRVRPFRRLGQR